MTTTHTAEPTVTTTPAPPSGPGALGGWAVECSDCGSVGTYSLETVARDVAARHRIYAAGEHDGANGRYDSRPYGASGATFATYEAGHDIGTHKAGLCRSCRILGHRCGTTTRHGSAVTGDELVDAATAGDDEAQRIVDAAPMGRCADCSGTLVRLDEEWHHANAAEGFDCADRRGDLPIIGYYVTGLGR